MNTFKTTIFLDSNIDKSYTYTLVNEILSTLENDYGYRFVNQVFSKDSLDIKYCERCFNCFNKLYCPLDCRDDLMIIKQSFINSDLIILALPVYINNLSGFSKNVIDRLSYWTHTHELIGKKCIIVSSAAHSGLLALKTYLESICTALCIEIIGELFIVKGSLHRIEKVNECVRNINLVLTGKSRAINADLLDQHFVLLKSMIDSKKIIYSAMENKKLENNGIMCSNSYLEYKKNAQR